MGEIRLVVDYKNNGILRKSFNDLAKNTFGIQFEEWFQKGFWNNRYIPYSFIDGDKVIANVSINLFNLHINGDTKKAIQIGTVMTHPDYRKKGLSAQLMKKIFEDHDETCDFMYLFANQTVLEFYPKFGFKTYQEKIFEFDLPNNEEKKFEGDKVNPYSISDIQFIYKLVKNRVPVSKIFGVSESEDVFMFHTLYVFPDDIYYFREVDALVVYQVKNDTLLLFDVVTSREQSIESLIPKIAPNGVKKVVLHFTPNNLSQNVKIYPYETNDVLFIRKKSDVSLPRYFKHPITSQA